MDCQMPVMNGYEASRRIRDPKSKVLNRSIIIIALTANAMQGDREKCIESGMNDFITKPIDPDKLFKLLEDWLPKHEIEEKVLQRDNIPDSQELIFDSVALSNRLMNDKKLIHNVAEIFLVNMLSYIERLKTSVMNEDFLTAESQSHQIKGASANVGGLALSTLAFKMEKAAQVEDLKTLRQLLEPLECSFTLLKTTMKAFLED
jgi:CheY-like chemotaxis protein